MMIFLTHPCPAVLHLLTCDGTCLIFAVPLSYLLIFVFLSLEQTCDKILRTLVRLDGPRHRAQSALC